MACTVFEKCITLKNVEFRKSASVLLMNFLLEEPSARKQRCKFTERCSLDSRIYSLHSGAHSRPSTLDSRLQSQEAGL